LKPALARGDLHCIGATTHEEFHRYIAPDAALSRRFQPVTVEEPTPQEALDILWGLKPRYEAFHAVTYTDAALESAVACASQYVSDRRLPDSAIDIIDEAAARRQAQGIFTLDRLEAACRQTGHRTDIELGTQGRVKRSRNVTRDTSENKQSLGEWLDTRWRHEGGVSRILPARSDALCLHD
jgi:ATP-dependent Clp protease ATP-binding subunit ClpA